MNRFLAGALIGVAIGLLMAPEKGEDLRTDITDTAIRWKKRVSKLIGKANANVDDLKTFLDRNIDGLTDDVKRKILSLIDEAKEMAYN